MTADKPLLEMHGIEKSFPGVKALDKVDLTVYPGEVVALIGENGAGKSTLMNILGGVLQQDSGTINIDGQ
ncbi:MAG TPA: ATP-binding cassette domain-containing protein, partial [Sedimentisphaerales bacterium]